MNYNSQAESKNRIKAKDRWLMTLALTAPKTFANVKIYPATPP